MYPHGDAQWGCEARCRVENGGNIDPRRVSHAVLRNNVRPSQCDYRNPTGDIGGVGNEFIKTSELAVSKLWRKRIP